MNPRMSCAASTGTSSCGQWPIPRAVKIGTTRGRLELTHPGGREAEQALGRSLVVGWRGEGSCARSEQIAQRHRAYERIGDGPAAAQRERGDRDSINLGDQRVPVERWLGVKGGEARELLVVVRK